MDWSAIKTKAASLGSKAAALGGKAVDASFSALEKASSHTYEGLKKTPISLKNGSELDSAKSLPLLMVLVLGKDDAVSKAILARLPAIFKDVWVYSASLKVILADEIPELVSVMGVSEPPAIFVYRKGELEKRFDGAAALEFSRNVDLSKEKTEMAPTPEGTVDVLAEALASEKGNPAPVAPVAPATTDTVSVTEVETAAPETTSVPVAPTVETPAESAPATDVPETASSEAPTPSSPENPTPAAS